MIFPLMIRDEKGPQNQSLQNPDKTPITDWQKPNQEHFASLRYFLSI